MTDSEDMNSLNGSDFDEFLENSSENVEKRNPFSVLRDQLKVKEKAVKDQQVALDIKDANLKDAEKSINDYDLKITEIEAKLRYCNLKLKLKGFVF